MNVLNLPTKEQFDFQNVLLASIASNIGDSGITITKWKDVQRIVRMGIHNQMFKIGDQFALLYNNAPTVWVVIGIDHDIPADSRFEHSLTIQSLDCLGDIQLSAPQALYHAKTELPVGEHVFTQDSSGDKYKFSTLVPVPEGGLVFISTFNEYVPTKITTYGSDRTTVIESGIDVTLTDDPDTLGEVNLRGRCRYGSNNYVESAVKQNLNSDAASFVWTPKTDYDMPSTSTIYNSGFLYKLDPELVGVLGAVKKQVTKNSAGEGGGQSLYEDKVFLLTRVEVGLGTEGTTTGEKVYDYYKNVTNADRIKLLNGSPRTWWLASPRVSNSISVRGVDASGALNVYDAVVARGLAPACVII